jgi:hypothetical protein
MKQFLAATTGLCAFAAISAAHAEMQHETGCPAGSATEWAADQTVSIDWYFEGIPPVMAFQPAKIVYGGGRAPLTPAEAAAYEPTFANLRAAAVARRKVTIYWDDATDVVLSFIVRWDTPC